MVNNFGLTGKEIAAHIARLAAAAAAAEGARQLEHFRYQKPNAPSRTLTETKTKKMKYSSSNSRESRSAGFFKKPASKNKNTYYGRKGGVYVVERGGLQTGPRCISLGHITLPREPVFKVIGMALVKAMVSKVGSLFEGWQNGMVANGFQVGDTSFITLRTLGNDINPNGTFTTVVVAAGTTFDDWANGIAGVLTAQSALDTEYERFSFSKVGGTDVYHIDLTTATLDINSKSSLKIQNQSTPAPEVIPAVPPATEPTLEENDSVDEVDAVPLYGKSYQGVGSGTVKLKRDALVGTDVSLLGDNICGIIARTDSQVQPIEEPGDGYEYAGVKHVGKVLLDPGQLKTSVISYNKVQNLNKWLDSWKGGNIPGLLKYKNNIGTFRFFTMEKMLEVQPFSVTPRSMTLGFEINLKIEAVIKHKTNTATQKLVKFV